MPSHRVLQVDLPRDDVVPGRGVGVLEVGHEDLRPRVEGVDHHLAFDRPGDLDPPVSQGLGCFGNCPLAIADVGRLGEEVEAVPGVEAGLALGPCRQQVPPAASKARCRSAMNSTASGVRTRSASGMSACRMAGTVRHD